MRRIITPSLTCYSSNENTVHVIISNTANIDITEMNELFSMFEIVSSGKRFKLIFELNELSYISMEAMLEKINHFQKIKHLIIAEAIVVTSPQNKLLQRYYLHCNRSHYPIMIFTNLVSAEIWLNKTIFDHTPIHLN